MGDLRADLNANRAGIARQLERERHRPVGDPMSAEDARKLTDRIKVDAERLWDRIAEAYLGRAHLALGYESWDTYCVAEFDSLWIRIPREERETVVCSLKQAGLSNRAIASAIGISEGTVRNDLKSGAQNYAPETDAEADELTERLIRYTEHTTKPEPIAVRLTDYTTGAKKLATVIGLDFKKYSTAGQRPAKPPPTDAELFDGELEDLDRAVDVMMRLTDHDQLSEDERAILAGRVADYIGRLQVIANKLQR